MAVNYLASCPKLLGRENYDEWCFAVENVFVLEGLTKCIDGTEEDSVLIAKAKAKLILTIDPTLYVHVKDATTAKDVWTKIRNLYEDTGYVRIIGLLRTLISLRLENCENMESYVNQVVETAQKLRKTGFKIDEEWIGSLLLAGLPEKYAPMIMAVEHSGIKVDTDSIKTKLLDMSLDGDSSRRDGALTARDTSFRKTSRDSRRGNYNRKTFDRTRTSNDKNKPKDLSDITCYKCKRNGHYMSKCPEMNASGTKEKKGETRNAFSAVFLNGNYNKNDFYLDSGASKHMTPNEQWMVNKSEPSIEQIVVANNEKVMVKCSGNINVVTTCKG